LSTAELALAGKQAEIRVIDGELGALPDTTVSPALLAALTAARALGDVGVQERELGAQLARAQRDRETAALQLAPWHRETALLRQMQLPPQDEVNALLRRQTELQTATTTLAERIAEQQSALNGLTLETTQYQTAHHPVSLADLNLAREQRDTLWQGIKSGALKLPLAAADFETEVANSDQLADRRHDKAQEASELQAKLDQQQRLRQQISDLQNRMQEQAATQTAFDADWHARMAAIGLDTIGSGTMPLQQINGWRQAREQTLHAAQTVAEAEQRLATLRDVVRSAQTSLAQALSLPPENTDMPFATLVLQAGETVDAASRDEARRATLAAQRIRANVALEEAAHQFSQAKAALDAWRSEWHEQLASAHLPADSDTGVIEAALGLFERMDEHFRQMRALRTTRIDTMQRDLDDFDNRAGELASAVAPALLGQPAEQIARDLGKRAAAAGDAYRERQRVQAEQALAEQALASAISRIESAQAELAPLLRLAAASDNDTLRSRIEHSDLARSLQSEIKATTLALQEGGDGLTRFALEAEFSATDLTQVGGELSTLKARVDALLEQRTRLAGELSSAQDALARIAGQDAAARAEAQRQEALARMANAAERYIKVHTAARLLRWAIERYRETKQGPMLSRAGDIFSALTLGSFSRLVLDYDSEPLTLYGQRATGEHVAIEGMSDGSRDQLYLALRLAALEQHLRQAPALPFIADDLFINYDDTRSQAGLQALVGLSEMTQVILLTHHDHLVPVAESVFGAKLNVIRMDA
jgi:hypothetical protein